MRIVPALILTLTACLALSQSVSANDPTSSSSENFLIDNAIATNTVDESSSQPVSQSDAGTDNLFYDYEFIYVPPPTPEPEHPLFYPGTFKYVPDGYGEQSGQLVRPASGPSLLSPQGIQGFVSENRDGAPSTALGAAPTPISGSEYLAKLNDGNVQRATSQTLAASTAETADSVRPMIPWDDIENPLSYHGSFAYDLEAGIFRPKTSQADQSTAVDVSVVRIEADDSVYGGGNLTFPLRGRAMYYNPGVMDRVLQTRLEMGHVTLCPECVGYVALLSRKYLNRKVWIEWENGDVEGPFLVIDAAAKQHVPSLLARNWVVDVDYDTAVRHGMNRPLPVTVYNVPPRVEKPKYTDQDRLFYYDEAMSGP